MRRRRDAEEPNDLVGARGVVMIAALLGLLGWALWGRRTGPPNANWQLPPPSIDYQVKVGLDLTTSWYKTASGSIAVASFRVVNRSNVTVRDLELGCVPGSRTGVALGLFTPTLHQWFPAGDTVHVKNLTLGFVDQQATELECVIRGWTVR